MREKVENKYTPSYNQVEAPPKVPAWKVPEQEHQFYYVNNDKFKHSIELDLAREQSQQRIKALKKLYFEYKNHETFYRAKQIHRKTSQLPNGMIE
jgi:hypothetical protein